MGITITVPKKYGSDITVTINNQKYTLKAGETVAVPLEVKAVLDDMERLQPKEAEKLALYEELRRLDPDFRAENIVDGVEMFGLVGTGGNLSAHPTLLPQDTWYTGKTATDKANITEIRVVDWYVPKGTEESWYADVEDVGKIKCYIDGTVLILSGNGSGRIMANPNSKNLFYDFTKATKLIGLSLIDTRNALTLQQALANLQNLTLLEGIECWDVRKCENFKMFMTANYRLEGHVDFSGWDVSCAVDATVAGTTQTPFHNMIKNCVSVDSFTFHKSFDLSLFFLPVPVYEYGIEGSPLGKWADADTGAIYSDKAEDSMFKVDDGLLNPRVEGHNITFEAVFDDGVTENV